MTMSSVVRDCGSSVVALAGGDCAVPCACDVGFCPVMTFVTCAVVVLFLLPVGMLLITLGLKSGGLEGAIDSPRLPLSSS